jgi:periplasmic protein TonB
MKKILFLSVFLISVFYSYSQEVINNEETEIYTLVEIMPSWKGCETIQREAEKSGCTYENIMNYLTQEIKYPEVAKSNKTEGKVFINFIIDEKGKVTDPVILRGVSPEIDAEALRVVSSMPDWNAGMQRGEFVAVQYNLPVNFRLSHTKSK